MRTLLARLLLVVSVAMAPALAFQVYSENQARSIRKQLAEEEALRLVRLVSAEQQRIAEGAEQVLDTIAGSPLVQDNMPALCQQLLTNLLRHSPRYTGAAVIGLDGHQICTPGARDPGLDMRDRTYFRLALQTGGFAVGDYAIGRGSGKPTLHMAKPFRNRDGEVAGVIEVGLSIDWLGQQLERVPLPPGATASIVDRNGTILARRPAAAGFVGHPLLAENRYALEGDVARVATMRGLDGSTQLVAYSPPGAEAKGLLVKVGLDRNSTFAAVTEANRTGMILIIAGVLAALIMTALVGGRLIRRPVAQLVGVADRWRQGDLAARSGLSADRSEFGRLAGAFDAMAAALQTREHALRTALESTTDSVMVFDRSWRITYVSERAKAHIGQGRDLTGRIVWEALPGTSDSIFAAGYREAMERGVPTHTVGYSAAFGTWFEAHAYPSEDGLTAFFRDVTEERRLAAALAESEALFRATFEQAAVGMAQTSLDGIWRRVNDKLCAITGYRREDLLGHHFREITHPDDLAADLALTRALLAGEATTYRVEKRYLRRDGEIVWATLTVSLMADPEGRPLCFIGIIEDISDRKRIEAALRQSETRLQLAREAAGFGVWDRDLITDQAVWSADQWRLYGLEPQAAGPSTAAWLASIHPDDRERVRRDRAAMLADPAALYDIEYRVVRPDGTVRWLLSSAKVVRDADGRPVRIVGLNMDVTVSRETEAALRRLSNDLEARVREEIAARESAQLRAAQAERLQALGQLAGGIAHDFNNVLQAILGAAMLVERFPGDEAGVRRWARRAIEAAERGASITRRLLTFGRRAHLRAEPLDAAALLSNLREMLAHTLGAGIDVQLDMAAGEPPLLADKGQLETVLVNLATNARDAMPTGGRLLLAAAAETVFPESPAHPAGLVPGFYLRLTVADTGSGMDAATLARAGEPFFTTKGIGIGTGLGLPMAKGFAEQSGGALSIESSPGQGTTVTLWLPAAGPRAGGAAAAPVPAPAARSAATGRVMLVDDEDLVREALADYLEIAGFQVLVASSGDEALALLASGESADVLVTDLSMPGIDGIALIKAVQERCPGLPAVLLTGHPDAAALGDGVVSQLHKPVSGADLIASLRAVLNERAGAEG